jgi:hypothetical protein
MSLHTQAEQAASCVPWLRVDALEMQHIFSPQRSTHEKNTTVTDPKKQVASLTLKKFFQPHPTQLQILYFVQ